MIFDYLLHFGTLHFLGQIKVTKWHIVAFPGIIFDLEFFTPVLALVTWKIPKILFASDQINKTNLKNSYNENDLIARGDDFCQQLAYEHENSIFSLSFTIFFCRFAQLAVARWIVEWHRVIKSRCQVWELTE
jgi:hypothetical protein